MPRAKAIKVPKKPKKRKAKRATKKSIRAIIEDKGRLYSNELGIKLETRDPEELYKWMLASFLFNASHNEATAISTYNAFKERDILTPSAVVKSSWQKLVYVLNQGGLRYQDFLLASALLVSTDKLFKSFDGDLNLFDKKSAGARKLEANLNQFFNIGPKAGLFFLRELRGIWEKAEPFPTDETIRAVRYLQISNAKTLPRILDDMKKFHKSRVFVGIEFREFELGLMRYGSALKK